MRALPTHTHTHTHTTHTHYTALPSRGRAAAHTHTHSRTPTPTTRLMSGRGQALRERAHSEMWEWWSSEVLLEHSPAFNSLCATLPSRLNATLLPPLTTGLIVHSASGRGKQPPH